MEKLKADRNVFKDPGLALALKSCVFYLARI